MSNKTYTIIPSSSPTAPSRRKWNGPRGKNIVGSFKRMARLMWDRQRFDHPFGSNPKKQDSTIAGAPAVAAT